MLDQQVHDFFHKTWGYKQAVTIDLFIKFLDRLINDPVYFEKVMATAVPRSSNLQQELEISSQSIEESMEGSETRVYDPNRIMKLKELMVESGAILYAKLTREEKDLADEILLTRIEKPGV